MAISRKKKEQQLASLVQKFKSARGVVFARFSGATVEEIESSRRALREKGISYTVLKKTLITKAALDADLCTINVSELPGAVAIMISESDTVLPAQELRRMKRENFDKVKKLAKFDFAGAIFEGKFLPAEAAEEFAATPTREESLAKIVFALCSGLSKTHGVLTSGLRSFCTVLNGAEKFIS